MSQRFFNCSEYSENTLIVVKKVLGQLMYISAS